MANGERRRFLRCFGRWAGGVALGWFFVLGSVPLAHNVRSAEPTGATRDHQAHPLRPLPGAELFRPAALHEIRIELAPADVDSLREAPRRAVAARVSIGALRFERVAVHLKGAVGSFREVDDKPGLTLIFDRFAPGQSWRGLTKIHLNNSVEDPSYLNEQFGSEFFRAQGVPSPRVAHARVQLNHRPLGLYVLKEGFTPEFLAGYFERSDGVLYEPERGQDVDARMKRHRGSGAKKRQPTLESLAAAAAAPDPELRWRRLGEVLDLDRFLTFMAVEVLLGHRDGYCLARNNFRLYGDRGNGRLVFLPHGMDQLLGTAELPWNPLMAGLVARAVLATPKGRELYRHRFTELFQNAFREEVLLAKVDSWVAALRSSLTPSEREDFERESALVKHRIANRASALRTQLAEPEPRLAAFYQGSLRLTGWDKVDEPAGGSMGLTVSADRGSELLIRAGPATTASWRAKALLPRGRYRFEGRAEVSGVRPLPFGKSQGAGLRVSGRTRPGEGLLGDAPAQRLAVEFTVEAPRETVEFIAELRASAGEVRFAADSMRVVVLP